MPLESLKKLLTDLKSGTDIAHIPLNQIITAMPLGKVCDMGEGKLCKGIRLWVDKNGKRNFWLEGFMPEGTYYELNEHEDADEWFYVVEGVLENTNFQRTKQAGEYIIWRAGTPHELLAITDLKFYAHLIEI